MSRSDAPLATTVMPAYNHERYVEEAVRSVWAQDYPNHELIAIDDGSSDRTPEILHRLAGQSPIPMQVHVKENGGLSSTLNMGIRLSNAEYINVCASDDRLTPVKVSALVGALEEADEDTMLAFGCRRYIDEDGKVFSTGHSDRFDHSGRNIFFEILTSQVSMPAPAVLYRRRLFDEVGFFAEDTKLEDYEMYLRITSRFHVKKVDVDVVEYRIHGTQTRLVHRYELAHERVRIVNSWIGKAPELDDPRAVREAKAYAYKYVGKEYFRGGEMAEARRWLLRSARYDPVGLEVRLIVRTVLGPRVMGAARAAKRRVLGTKSESGGTS